MIDSKTNMVEFTLDGRSVVAAPDDSIWETARKQGVAIPHLCHSAEPGYRPDGNCRVCMVEIKGERVLAASCIRRPNSGMEVTTDSTRAVAARKMVFELLLADQPARDQAFDPGSKFWSWAEKIERTDSRFPARAQPLADRSHPAMAVQLAACIQCNLCVRACREVQVNDVIGMAHRGHASKIVFDLEDPMGASSCVGCGECVQSCPTGALMPSAELDFLGRKTQPPDRSQDSLCPYCGVGCQVTYQIRNEKILSVRGKDGPANHQRLCVKGRFGFDYIHHPNRLTKPLIRRTDAPQKSADAVLDPSEFSQHFREATWDEALNFAASGLRKIRDERGGKALAGFGSAKGSNEEAYLFQKLVRTGFGGNNVDHCTRLCHASSVAALMETIGSGAVTAPFSACADSDVIIIIGANPTVNHPVAATFIKNATKRGAKLVVIDPRGQSLSRFATHNLRFRPGTDVALLNAILHVVVDEKLYDPEYVERFTDGFDQFAKSLKSCTPEAMAPLCGIDAETLRAVARLYATSRAAMIFWGMGISQHVHGTDNARCLIALALLCGQVGRPGAGLHPLRGQNNVQGASDAGLIPMFLPDYHRVGVNPFQSELERLWGTTIDPEPGLTVVEIMGAIHQGSIRGMYVLGENPAMSDPDVSHARKALASLDHLVVQDLFLTETAFHADVILPASAFPEKTGTFTNTDRRVQMGRQVLMPPGDAKPDWWIIQEIARRMDLDWNYEHPRSVYGEMQQCMPSLANISWDRLEREGAVTYPCDAEDVPGHDILFRTGFPTPNGRGKLVPATVSPPDELPDSEYPFILSTGRVLEHWHTGSMTRRSTTLDAIEPDAIVLISPKDLEKIGSHPGGRVRIETRRGSVELMARADRDVSPGLIFLPFCYAEAAANLLTNPALDPFGKIPEFKFCAAKVEPI